MHAEERHALIQQELTLSGKLMATEFAEKVGVSGMTLRRDLATLERRGVLRRVHGGAVPADDGLPGGASAFRPAAPSQLTIGLLVPTSQYYFSLIIKGAGRAAQQAGARLVLGVSGYDPDEELRLLKRFLASPIDALLITPLGADDGPTPTLEALYDARIPVVLVERPLENVLDPGPWDSVFTDHVRGTERLVRRWVQSSGGPVALGILEDSPNSPPIEAGYRRALELTGHAPHVVRIPSSAHGHEAHRAALARLAESCRAEGIRGVLVHNDGCALALTELFLEQGVRVPEDVEVVAYDDEIASLGLLPLSAVAPPKFELGHRAASLCLQRVRDGFCARERVALSPQFVPRQSTRTQLPAGLAL
ncbi:MULTISPECIES: LacI family DNA-binding transcriptional regulator [Arthrobacter]|uniref:DNA-binding transcriptional regulator, LacI/PurR family n=1 Tax=Arthrobacter woluwensis TaxID=156980 RepID=A0A1H4LUK9_9MICC|nr:MULTISPECIES: LacI family DNA-binding transcriptional regulator [Arthrobacter]MBO9704310.1 substrate-binding domain-containing protein [Arthrobacter sp.]PSS42824.1 HTH domain-containing protein [Arthrobacter woluwensis]QTF72377.1 DeoR/GlpR family transcriptional regulator [Arthrobacter woluwensis]WFR83443.1 substrate-binding domain-containing protein [Arthrobacter sp. Y-9]SEB74257.1 DNA-binding transcriptional regulator, LacI/PurR family [Arthrobacter woluwensis]